MHWSILVISTFLLTLACSSPKKEQSFAELENVPFEKLHAVRVMPFFIAKTVDQNANMESIKTEFGKFGEVHTPADTNIDQLTNALEKPFALLTIYVNEVGNLLSVEFRLFEEGRLKINDKDSMGNVWEKIIYTSPEQISEEISKIIGEFSQNYSQANPDGAKPSFYISNPI